MTKMRFQIRSHVKACRSCQANSSKGSIDPAIYTSAHDYGNQFGIGYRDDTRCITKRHRYSNECGFTLVEMLAAMMIFAIAIAVSSQMASLFITGGATVDAEFNSINQAQLLEMGLSKYIRLATAPTPGAAPFSLAGQYTATAYVNANNSNGLDKLVITTSASGSLQASLIPPIPGSCGVGGCSYSSAGGIMVAQSNYISNMSTNTPLFTYLMSSGVASPGSIPSTCSGASTVCLGNIVAVTINIVVPAKTRDTPNAEIKTTVYLEAPVYDPAIH